MKIPKFKLNFKLIILAIISLIVLLSLVIVVFFVVNSNLLDRLGFFEKSTMNLSFEKERVNIKFNFIETDRAKATEFSKKINTSTNWMEGMTFELDPDTVMFLQKNVPNKVFITFSESGIEFRSESVPLLKSALPDKKYTFSTGSAVLNLNAASQKDYDLQITNPKNILQYASDSGKIRLSNRMDGVLPILDKIAKIEIESRGGEVKGWILLKQ